jgi:ferritin
MIEKYQLQPTVINALNARIGDEYTAHFFYNSAYNWCLLKNYKKAAAFFLKEMASELGHAQELQRYLVDWNTAPTIPHGGTNYAFTSLPDIIETAYRIEHELLTLYVADSMMISKIDLVTYDFLQQFRKFQLDAVIEYSDLLSALELIDTNSGSDILDFEERYMAE